MRTSDKKKGNQDMGRRSTVTKDPDTLQHHIKKLEVQIKRLRETVKANGLSNLY
jgi:hypothetical protein